jgi:hypothetical protein
VLPTDVPPYFCTMSATIYIRLKSIAILAQLTKKNEARYTTVLAQRSNVRFLPNRNVRW